MRRIERIFLQHMINAQKRKLLIGRNGPNLEGEGIDKTYPGDWMPECRIFPAVSHCGKRNRI